MLLPRLSPTQKSERRRWLYPLAAAMVVALAGCATQETGPSAIAKPDLARAAQINTQLGVDYARQGDYALAQQKLERAISQRADYAPAHSALAFVYSRTGSMENAEREYRRALQLAPDDPDIQNNFGTFLCSEGKGVEAQQYFQRALASPHYSTPAAAWTNAGVCALNMQQRQDAERDFESALRADPDFAQAVEHLAVLSYQNGNYLRARTLIQHYSRLARLGPGMLLLSSRVERALGDTARAQALEVQLIQNYPQSREAAEVGAPRS
ncbi:MAG TPA: type IV pilus biogenesis/stability protein PilW [Nevskiaceae bacterium]